MHPTQNIDGKAGKRPKKLKVRHLSQLTRDIIVDRFESLLDADEVATDMDVPGLTGKTVLNVLAAHLVGGRKPPAKEQRYFAIRRSA